MAIKLFTIMLLFLAFTAKANGLLSPTDSTHKDTLSITFPGKLPVIRYRLIIKSNNDYGSNCLTNELVSTVYHGKFISEDIKERFLKRCKNNYNRIGGDLDQSVSLLFKPSRILPRNYHWLELTLANRTYFNAGFNKDLATILLKGNTSFLNSTANMSASSLHLLQYQQLRIGFTSETNDSTNSRFVFGLSYLNGQRNTFILADTLTLSYDTSINEITSRMLYQCSQTISSQSKFGYGNGKGFAIDVDFRQKWQFNKNTPDYNILRAGVRDLGFIRWDKHTRTASVDTIVKFNGLTLNNLNDSIINPFTTDSLKSSYLPFVKQKYSTSLPAFIFIENYYYFSKKDLLSLSYQIRTFSAYRPQFTLRYERKLSKSLFAGISASKGGFNNYGLHADIKLGVLNRLNFYAGINNIQGWLLPKQSGAKGVFVNLSYWF